MRKINEGESIAFDISLKVLVVTLIIALISQSFDYTLLTQKEYVMDFTLFSTQGNLYSITFPPLSIWYLPVLATLSVFGVMQVVVNFPDLYHSTETNILTSLFVAIAIPMFDRALAEIFSSTETVIYYQVALLIITIHSVILVKKFTHNFLIITLNTFSMGIGLIFFVFSREYSMFETISFIVIGFLASFIFSLIISSLIPFLMALIQKIIYGWKAFWDDSFYRINESPDA